MSHFSDKRIKSDVFIILVAVAGYARGSPAYEAGVTLVHFPATGGGATAQQRRKRSGPLEETMDRGIVAKE